MDDTYPMPAHGWTCFHCGETFKTPGYAREHFGFDPSAEPACRIKVGAERGLVRAVREAEAEAAKAWSALHNESSDFARAYHAQAARHGQQLQTAEEAGYERGLADARAEAKALQDEVTYWRQDAAARLRTAMTLARAAETKGEEDRAAEIRVSIIYPTRAALANALSGDIYWPLCEGCAKPLQGGDAVYAVGDGDGDGGHCGDVHVDCDRPQLADLPEDAYRFAHDDDYSPEKIAATLAEACAFLEGEG